MLKRLRQGLGMHDQNDVTEQMGMAYVAGMLRALGVPDAELPAKLKAIQQRRRDTEAVMMKVQYVLRQFYGFPCSLDLLSWYATSQPISGLDVFEEAYRQLCAGDDHFVKDLQMYRVSHSNML